MNIAIWDENAEERHAQILSGLDISLSKVVVPELASLFSSIPNCKELNIIEIGCGTGYLMKVLATSFSTVHGIDPSPKAIDIAKKYLFDLKNVSLDTCQIEDYVHPHSPFDLAVSHMTFQVIDNLLDALNAVNRLLVDKGKFVFSIPHPFFWPIYKNLQDYAYIKSNTYQVPFTITNDRRPLKKLIPYIHRSLAMYSENLKRANFVISDVLEPFPTETIQKEFITPWEYPHFLFFVCEKK